MILSLVFYCGFTTTVGAEPPQPYRPPPNPLFVVNEEASLRKFLEWNRTSRALMEGTIETFERILNADLLGLTAESESDMRRQLDEWRHEVDTHKRFERELESVLKQWNQHAGVEAQRETFKRLEKLHDELWPPPAVAPMPREVKR
jgi:hypothetical protein